MNIPRVNPHPHPHPHPNPYLCEVVGGVARRVAAFRKRDLHRTDRAESGIMTKSEQRTTDLRRGTLSNEWVVPKATGALIERVLGSCNGFTVSIQMLTLA